MTLIAAPTIVWLLVNAASATSQKSDAPELLVLPGHEKELGVSREMLFDFLVNTARAQMASSRKHQASLKTPQEWRKQQQTVRAHMIESIGGLPDRTPLNARIVGTLDRGDYRVDKLIYESRPRYYVTANLYVPDRDAQKLSDAKLPAILSPCGHSANGKCSETYQHVYISLAKKGFIVLAYDPLSQGERSEYLDAATGKDAVPIGTGQHCQSGNVCYLTGTNLAQYRIWDGVRGIDYLCGREDVDPARIGVTGNSGGGTLTTYITGIDERVACSAPGCYVTTLVERMLTRSAADAEQNSADTLLYGVDHAEMLSPLAPKPLMILCAQKDFFPIVGALESFSHLQTIYATYGAIERVSIGWANDQHGYNLDRRERAYAWFLRWLGDPSKDWREPPHMVEQDKDLYCTETGHVQTSLGGETVFSMNKALAERVYPKRPVPASPADVDAFAKEIRAAAAKVLRLPTPRPRVSAKVIATLDRGGVVIEKVAIKSEKGIVVPGLLLRSAGANGRLPAVLHIHEAGKSTAAQPGSLSLELVQKGRVVLSIDPRGMGETMSPHRGKGRADYYGWYGTEADLTYSSFMIGRPMLGLRVFDALQSLDYLLARKDVDPREVTVVGRGYGGTIALFVAALDDRVTTAVVDRSLAAYRLLVDNQHYKAHVNIMLPGVLKYLDLPDLAAAVAPRRLMLIDAMDHMQQPLSADRAKALFDRALRCYAATGKPDNIHCLRSVKAEPQAGELLE